MNKNFLWKILLIVVLVVIAVISLYPPNKKLKPGIDLAGGTSLIYEINDEGLEEAQKRDLSQRMINVLRRRVDKNSVRNLIWRPQGNRRFEIQMPLASQEAREKRQLYEQVLTELLHKNVNISSVMRSLTKDTEERSEYFETISMGEPNRLEILETLATTYDDRNEFRKQRDALSTELKNQESKFESAGLDLRNIKLRVNEWNALDEQALTEQLENFLSEEGQNNVPLLSEYVGKFGQWAEVVEALTNPETGKNVVYEEARRNLDTLNLSEDQIGFVLQMNPKSTKRIEEIEKFKREFPDRQKEIDNIIAAYEEYRPFRGRLDDPRDLQRMLRGAGVLEFRILPTQGHPQVDSGAMDQYVQTLKTKGPKYASDNQYIWCEIEDTTDWLAQDPQGNIIVGQQDAQGRPVYIAAFGDKFYVLASNKKDESVIQTGDQRTWTLEGARPTSDRMGRRAIGFTLDARGGKFFSNVTGKNIDRPLCILLDEMAISSPNIQSRISTDGVITGRFSETQVYDMVNKLDAGALPAMLIEQPISEKTIGPSIGADNRDQGIKAGLIGLVMVVICMLVYYLLAGSIADIALLMNILFVLATMAVLRATFTLPGIAGIILTIGMSVDANVLIFERIREEQQKGSSLRVAIRNGYERAFRAIFDANLTTFMTAGILYMVASEEIKGFAIVLMLGILSSMFSALFVTRVAFDLLLSWKVLKERIVMLRLIHQPNVNWMGKRPIFLTLSTLLIVAGLFVFFTRDDTKNNKYDIEFTGGTSAQINLKQGVELSRQEVQDRIQQIGTERGNPALASANVYSIGNSNTQYEITTTETNKTIVTITFDSSENQSIEAVKSAILKAQAERAGILTNLQVQQAQDNPLSFVVTTSQINPGYVEGILKTAFGNAQISEPQVQEVVNDAIIQAFSENLEIQQNLRPTIVSQDKITSEVINTYPELTDFSGGLKIMCEVETPTTTQQIDQRIKDLRFKPDTQDLIWYNYILRKADLSEVTDPNEQISSFAYISSHPEAGLRELTEEEWTGFLGNETTRVLAASRLETSLPRVTQIDPSIGAEAKTRALIAIVLSLFAIVAYVGFRFGDVRFGLAAIAALVHDVCITLGAVTACTYIAFTKFGETLLIGDFKIDLAMIAAFLTLIGYSLNDTIVVFDRIRENRRKDRLNQQIITNSINQTISRTILTSFTTFIVVFIMYIFGGQGLRGFTFAIGLGVIIGTYSSIAIAAPILLLGKKKLTQK
ncbi:MAG: protein translocase subunit SecD [Planctomycetota bacterium]|jgi:SecD/SecF fusion protein